MMFDRQREFARNVVGNLARDVVRNLALLLLTATALAPSLRANPQIPGESTDELIAIVDAQIYPVSSPPIANGVVLFRRGRILAVGSADEVKVPATARRIQLRGRRVYPALFDAVTNLGLVEINAVRATRDHTETGRINPNVQAHLAVNPDSELIPVTRSNGVLLAGTAPQGGLISGKASVLQLDGWTYEDLTLKPNVGLMIRWPRASAVSDWWVEKSAKEQLEARDRDRQALVQAFASARAYQRARTARGDRLPKDARWEAMLPVLERKTPVIIEANDQQQIQSAVAFARRQRLRMILLGGYDAPRCARLLKENKIPVILGGVYRLPRRRSDPYDAPFTLPQRLREAEIPFCISTAGRFGASQVRNLPYHAAMAVAFGLSRADALRAITLEPAKILGVANRVGSLEKGKDATFIVTRGDPLETATQVEAAYIRGAEVDLDDRHKALYRKYSERLRRRQPAAKRPAAKPNGGNR